MSSTNFVSIPAGLLSKRQRRTLHVEQPSEQSSVVSEFLDAQQLSTALNVSDRTIDAWKQKGLIPFLRVGRVVRFDLAAVKRALEQYRVHAKKTVPARPRCPWQVTRSRWIRPTHNTRFCAAAAPEN